MNEKIGFYKVGNLSFHDKLDAVLYASKYKLSLEWYFHDHIYNSVDWTIEPPGTLDDYYKLRAQQIREEFDYIVVLCSGGGDSTNVVLSFLRNGIKVDEVIASAPLEGIKNYNTNSSDTSAGNTMSETVLAQLPLMQLIHSEWPDVKITINDYFQTLLEYTEDDWLFRCGEWIHPTSAARYDLGKIKHLRDLAESGKKIGIIYGIDKPHLFYDVGDTINIMMSDLTVNVQRPPFKDKYPNVQNVLFYFAPELPLMQVKQAHVLAKWIHCPENKFAQSKILDLRLPLAPLEAFRIQHSFYERAIIPCIYPSTNRKVFQGHKPTRMFFGEHDAWFYKQHSGTKTFQMLNSDFRNFIREVDPFFLNTQRTGFKVYKQIHTIGKINDFRPAATVVVA